MRVYVIHPGASFSTHDVYVGVCAGLRAHGIEVIEGRIDTIMQWYEMALRLLIAASAHDARVLTHNEFGVQRRASAHITQHILETWPDLVLSVSGHNYHLRDVEILHRVGIKIACILTESPYFLELEQRMAGVYKRVFTNERAVLESFRSVTPTAWYLPAAFNTEVHTPGAPDPSKSHDVFFVGSWFEERRRLLERLQQSGIDLQWLGHDLTDQPKAIIDNATAAAYYRSACVSLNIHRADPTAYAESLNPRAYEIAACGGFQLMDDSRAERFDVFGDDVPTFRAGNADDLVRQTRYWMTHPDQRDRVAQAMHAAVQPHNWTQRISTVLEALL